MPDDEIEVETQIISSTDGPYVPSDGGTNTKNSGYIRARVIFNTPSDRGGRLDVSEDVISISTDQGTSKQEGDATAKMTVTLNNNNNYYANKLLPQMSEVEATIIIERNVITGRSLTVENKTYPIYYGRVQEVQLNHEHCIVECGDESSNMEASIEHDLTFFPDKSAHDRALEIISAVDPEPVFSEIYADNIQDIQIESFQSSTQSGQSTMSEMLKDMSLDWAVQSDRMSRLIIFNKEIKYGTTNLGGLTQFISDPGDSESIIGHCNVVTIIADGKLSTTGYDKNIISSDSNETYLQFPPPGELEATKSYQKYGRLAAPAYPMTYLSTMDEIENFASNLLDLYASYEDRTLTPTLVSIIPFLSDSFNYSIYGNASEPVPVRWHATSPHPGAETPISRLIRVQMLRKQITYDTGGVVVQTECIRWQNPELTTLPDDAEAKTTSAPFSGGNGYMLWYKLNDIIYLNPVPVGYDEMVDFRDNRHYDPDDFEVYDPSIHIGLESPF